METAAGEMTIELDLRLSCAVALLLFSAAVLAAEEPPQEDPGTLLGLGVRSRPDYDGASKQELELIPVIRYYGRTLFARTTQGILEGGARMSLSRGLDAGVQLAYEGGNDRTDVDPGASIGVHLEWDTKVGPAPVNLLFRTRHHLDSDLGSQADLRGAVGVYGGEALKAWLFGQATWATDEWVRSYYTTGDGGLLLSSVGIEGAYDVSRHWVAVASASVRRLHGDAASSPITEDKTNYYVSVGLAYRF
jgi:outer membrane scaffolding protein for murein synthesis (MipA/OmpV family)